MNTHIFISYGHDEFTEKVKVIMKSLNEHKEYQIWWDGDLKKSVDWVRQIENSLDELISNKPNSCFIYIVTPYSTSDDRYNFCMNEILRALEGCVRILPIRLSSAPMPLPIGSIQWLDMTQCEINVDSKEFQSRLETLCKLIDSRESVKVDGRQGALHRLLTPCQFTLDIDKHLRNYCPRQWLLDATMDWLDKGNNRILMVVGGPGTGKTAYSLWISTCKMPERIHAWHLCQYNDVNTRSQITCVKSLIWYLASRLPYFYDSLEISQIEKMVQGGEENSGAMLRDLVIGNLKETNVAKEKIVILIDALDEASENGENRVAEMLAQYVDEMPEWLRFIITTRNDSSVTLPLKEVAYVIDLDEQSNRDNCVSDIRAYVAANLYAKFIEKNKGIVNLITEKSGNVILYAKLMCDAIGKGENVDMLQLPQGLGNFYDAHMRRYFGAKCKYDYETYALPIIHIMLASFQPIKRDLIYKRIHETEDWCKDKTRFKRVLNCFGPLLKDSEEYILPFHKSLCDWLTDGTNQRFYASREDGIEKMCEWGAEVLYDEFADEELKNHFDIYYPQYLIEAKKYKDLLDVFSCFEFWKQRRDALGIDMMFQRMFVEISLMNEAVKRKLFQNQGFKDVLIFFDEDLFDKGLFVQLKKNGFAVNLSDQMCDKDRMMAFRYLYVNGEYSLIRTNLEFFCRSYEDKDSESKAQNLLGLAAKKCGLILRSVDFYRRAISLSIEQNIPIDRIIYYRLNLCRVLVILCRFDEGRRELESALNLFYSNDWCRGIDASEIEFASRQLELAVRYVNLETELFSTTYDSVVCKRELVWADELYSSKMRIDRYYPRHLQSKILFLLREHKFDEIVPVIEELVNGTNVVFDDVRSKYYIAIYYYAIGQVKVGLGMAMELLNKLGKDNNMLIEKTELLALIDTMEKQDHFFEIGGELKPWYMHTISIIKQIVI